MAKRGRKKSLDTSGLLFFEHDFYKFLHRVRDGWPKRADFDDLSAIQKAIQMAAFSGKPEVARRFYHSALPGAPKLWEKMTKAGTKNKVRAIGRTLERFPLHGGCVLTKLLREHPSELLKAKRHPRYPRRKNENGEQKRIDFLARWFSGIALGISGQSAVEHLRKMKHGPQNRCWRCGPLRNRPLPPPHQRTHDERQNTASSKVAQPGEVQRLMRSHSLASS